MSHRTLSTLVRLAPTMALVLTATAARAQDHVATDPGAPASDAAEARTAAAGEPAAEPAYRAPLLAGMGSHHHPIATDVPLAQRYFDQGLVLAFGFNHAEAARAFGEAARLDPACAMCNWGVALVLGPNINAAMDPSAVPEAWAALETAKVFAADAPEGEQGYVAALAKRYAEEPGDDRSALDAAYADAMRELSRRYPDDLDAASLFAEALMDTMPWDYWTPEGEPKPATREVLATLESILARAPDHPLANHLYIHAVEAVHPDQAEAAADRLGALVPGAGHLVHMPGHIYIRTGRYHDAVVANQRAVAADDAYVTQCHAQGLYPLGYMPHNHHFLWAAASLEGASAMALDSARHIAEHTDPQMMREPGFGTLQHYWVTPLYAMVRFGKWDDLLAAPQPDADLVYPNGVWRYARVMALVRKGRLDEAKRELDELEKIAADPALDAVTIWDINSTRALLDIAADVVAGELAAARGEFDAAIGHLGAAVAGEDALRYDEPPPWHYPVRQSLGAVLLRAGKPAEAEAAYRKDLARFPDNGWSLFGLAQSLAAQDRPEEAAAARARFATAWSHADVELTASEM